MNRLDIGWTLARFFLGFFMFYHGASKALGWFGGFGWSATVEAMSNGYPTFLVHLAIISEFIGGIALMLGILTRFAGFGVFCTMMVAAQMHFSKDVGGFAGYFTNQMNAGKFEYPFLLGIIALGCVIVGAGK